MDLKFESAAHLIKRELPPRRPILAPWLNSEETCVVWAASGVGKTMFSLSLAVAVAGGGKLGDWDAPEARKVLYVDGEMNIRDLKERTCMLMHDKGVLDGQGQIDQAGRNLTFVARQDQDDTEFYDLTNTDHQEALVKRVKDCRYELVILDNFTTLSSGLTDENDSTAFKKVQELFMELKRSGVATILVHHANKGGKSMRGSTALEATFELIIGLTKPKVSSVRQASFILEFGKNRSEGHESLAPKVWRLGDTGWALSDDLAGDPKEDPIYMGLISLDYVSGNDLAKGLGMAPSTVHNRISKLVALDAISRQDIDDCYQKAKELKEEAEYMASDEEEVW